MTYKCKICGGQTTVDIQSGVAVCEYCGTKQALPLFSEDSERLLYDRGNNYLLHSEYDKAENVFNQLLTIKPSAAELYWDLVLCKYGVTYVKDPKIGKYIPTCNRTHYTPIFSDENYKRAIELSSGEKKALFEEDAKTIDNIQKGIIAVSKKEKPFDIFISYKETDANGNRTKDSIEAQKLYEKLTEAGYKVFFSRITLEDKIGTEYEPYIYAALYSSKVMLTICSSKENIEAVWVKNEWSRFLGFRQNDSSKTLLPLYFDMDKADLPEEFALLSSYDMTVDGFKEELLRGIKKLVPQPISKAEKRKRVLLTLASVFAAVLVVSAVFAAIFIPRYLENQEAERQFLAEQQAAQEQLERYNSAVVMYENGEYAAAAAAFEKLGDYKDCIQMLEKCALQPKYDAAINLLNSGSYAEATWAFTELGDYEDAADKKIAAELSWRKSLSQIAYDSFGELMADGMGGAICEAARYGAYVDENGNINSFYSKSIDTATEVSAVHGKVCDYSGLYDDGFYETFSGKSNSVVQVVGSNFYLTVDGTAHFFPNNYGNNFDWAALIEDWSDLTKLFYFSHQGDNAGTEILLGLKADGTIKIAGYIEDYSNTITEQSLSSISDVRDFTVGAMGINDYNYTPFEFCVAILTEKDTCLLYNLDISGEFSYMGEATNLPENTKAVSITPALHRVNVLTTNGDLYQFDITSMQQRGYIKDKNFVSVNAYMAISNSGTHYRFDFSDLYQYPDWCLPDSFSPRIYDEWTKGLM